MIYLDNAATSGKKPAGVIGAVNYALRELSANPGRGGHRASIRASETVFAARQKVAGMFGAAGEDRVIFTPSCTYSLNFAMKGILRRGDHLLISSIEHNASARPAEMMRRMGDEVDIAEVIFSDPQATVRSFERLMKPNTRAVVCTHASNVTGEIMPIAQLGALCREKGILLIVDAAQTAGILPIDMQKMQIDYLCIAPHKGLYAPMGCGILIANGDIPHTVIEGGTGVASALPVQPDDYPERMESGTLPLPAIAGLSAGIDFVNTRTTEKIYRAELGLIQKCYAGLSRMGGITLYTPYPEENRFVPVLSFNVREMDSSEVAARLDRYGIAVRAGLHCAPSVHKRLGTIENGTVRISTSTFNTPREIDFFLECTERIVRDSRRKTAAR